ncbi:hypothetical protein [Bradyrhizobium sp. WSM1253]|uniref:hypothetical protein n=1 Tax=Bradyrhizobium sp. WSM1253 TaxID=319003 RepID=UPI001FD9F464|nr:hypothetical protein [Bradyrhizobium sp. WSM1253]
MSEDADFIISAASRLAGIAKLAAISFGLADGVNEAMKAGGERLNDYAWVQASRGFQDGALMIAVIRSCIVLDADPKTVSFQGVYKRLKLPAVQRALIDRVYDGHEESQTMFGPPPTEMVDQFLATYREINWDVHSRLIHFRNYGVAHLLDRKNWKSITYDEMRDLVSLVVRLGDKLIQLCHLPLPPIDDTVREYTDFAKQALAKD